MTKLSIHEQQLQDIIKAVSITDAHRYTIHDESFTVYNQQPIVNYTGSLHTFGDNQSTVTTTQYQTLAQDLTNTLYTRFYCGIAKDHNPSAPPPKEEQQAFIETLSKANQSRAYLDRNWTIYSIAANGAAFAQKNGQLRPVLANTYVQQPQQANLSIGQKIDFYRIRENKTAQPVFYHTYGETYLSPDNALMRVYWNIQPEGAALLTERITRTFNAYSIPFNFKCLNHPNLYERSDSAVLYFDKDYLGIAARLIRRIREIVRPYLKNTIPLFTKPIANGVSLAEDPGDGQSFGMSRCTLIAKGLVEAFKKEIQSSEQFTFIQQFLTDNGLNPNQLAFHPHTQHYLLAT